MGWKWEQSKEIETKRYETISNATLMAMRSPLSPLTLGAGTGEVPDSTQQQMETSFGSWIPKLDSETHGSGWKAEWTESFWGIGYWTGLILVILQLDPEDIIHVIVSTRNMAKNKGWKNNVKCSDLGKRRSYESVDLCLLLLEIDFCPHHSSKCTTFKKSRRRN